jgi:hypothetical protein
VTECIDGAVAEFGEMFLSEKAERRFSAALHMDESMNSSWIGLAVVWLMLNAMAMFLSSQTYTAWSIRTRNQGYYMIFGREVNRKRAEDAEVIAERVVRWLRPLCLVVVNSLWIYLLSLPPK